MTILIVLVFSLTAIDKVLNWHKHIRTMKNYRIVTGAKLHLILTLMILGEIYISISLILNGATLANTATFLALISLYTIAIVINLIRGNVEMSCGCGSILESNRLTYRLVLRNFIFVAVFIVILINQEYKINQLFPLEIILMLLLSICILILGSLIKEVMNGREILNKILRVSKLEGK